MKLSVRKLMLILLIAVFAAAAVFVYLGASPAKQALEPVTLMIAADPHYIAPTLTDNGLYFTDLVTAADGKYMMECEALTDAFLDRVLELRPDALILPGDLTFNGARESHLALVEKLGRIRAAGTPVYVVPGNHDINSTMAASFHSDGFTRVANTSPEEFEEIYADFGYSSALSRDSASLSYLAELPSGLLLLAVDVNTPLSPGALSDSTLQWIRSELHRASRQGKQVLAVSHQTVLEHSFLSYGFVIRGVEPLLSLYEKSGVICNLSGHMHVQHTQSSENGFLEISGSSLITWPHQYGLLTLDGHSAEYHTESLPLDFAEESRLFLWNTSRRQVEEELQTVTDPTERESLADYLADCNIAYLAGRAGTVDWDDPRYERWQSVPSLFAYYLQTIRLDSWQDHTRLAFSF